MITVKINEIEEVENKTDRFPYIGKYVYNNKLIVLFNKDGCGTILAGVSELENYYIGDYKETWNTVLFNPIDEEVVLRNMK